MRFTWIVLLLGLAIPSCSSPGADAPGQEATSNAISSVEFIEIEEDADNLIVDPRVRVDPEGGFLVTDVQEAQVRRYDPSGRLLWRSGRRGQGPGEYVAPVSAMRLGDGTIAVLDRSNRVTLLSGDGEYIDSFQLPFARVSGMIPVDGNTALVRGLSDQGSELLHYLNLSTRTIEDSFLPTADLGEPGLSRSFAYATADVLNGRIAAAHGPLDSVYVYSLSGERLTAFQLPVDNFRLLVPSPSRDQSPQARAQWESTFETMSAIWWVNPTLLAVGYKTLLPGGIDFHWALVTTSGELVHREIRSGDLLAVDPQSATLVLGALESEVPNLWRRLSVVF